MAASGEAVIWTHDQASGDEAKAQVLALPVRQPKSEETKESLSNRKSSIQLEQ